MLFCRNELYIVIRMILCICLLLNTCDTSRTDYFLLGCEKMRIDDHARKVNWNRPPISKIASTKVMVQYYSCLLLYLWWLYSNCNKYVGFVLFRHRVWLPFINHVVLRLCIVLYFCVLRLYWNKLVGFVIVLCLLLRVIFFLRLNLWFSVFWGITCISI